MKPKNPIQPLATDDHGTLRFKANVLVKALLDQPRGLDLNALTERFHRDEHADDWRQLAQLIGYSLSGYSELGYVDDASYDAAVAMHERGLTEDKARIATLEAQPFSHD